MSIVPQALNRCTLLSLGLTATAIPLAGAAVAAPITVSFQDGSEFVTDIGSVVPSAAYMLLVSLVVLGLFYWRRGIDRRAAVVCLGLYLPTFLFV